MIRIGLSTNQDAPGGGDCMPSDYIQAVIRAGALPLIFPLLPPEHAHYDELIRGLINSVDAIVFTGGPDVDPSHYGQEKLPGCGKIHPSRDKEDLAMIRAALDAGKPMLGICRGLQMINVAMGGSLHQDLSPQMGITVNHNRDKEVLSVHTVQAAPDSLLRRVTGMESFPVNSRHHQAIDRLGTGLRAAALSEDGLIEALEFENGYPGLALQWHPENLASHRADQQAIFHWLAGVAEQRR